MSRSADNYVEWTIRATNNDPELVTIAAVGADRVKRRVNLTGLGLRLVIEWPTGLLVKTNADGGGITVLDQTGETNPAVDPATTVGQFNVSLSFEERALLPLNEPAKHELYQVANGIELTMFWGDLVATKWTARHAP